MAVLPFRECLHYPGLTHNSLVLEVRLTTKLPGPKEIANQCRIRRARVGYLLSEVDRRHQMIEILSVFGAAQVLRCQPFDAPHSSYSILEVQRRTPMSAIIEGFRTAYQLRREQRSLAKLQHLGPRLLVDMGFDPGAIEACRNNKWSPFD